jgi:hypothetical protein
MINRATVARIGSLAPVAGLLYVVTHFGTVTTIAAAATVGCAVWGAAKVKGTPAPAQAPAANAEQIVQEWEPPAAALPAASSVDARFERVMQQARARR